MKYLVIILMVGSISAMAAKTLKSRVTYCCTSADSAVVDSCYLESNAGSSDEVGLEMPLNDLHSLTAGQQTDLDAILVDAVADTKTTHGIP